MNVKNIFFLFFLLLHGSLIPGKIGTIFSLTTNHVNSARITLEDEMTIHFNIDLPPAIKLTDVDQLVLLKNFANLYHSMEEKEERSIQKYHNNTLHTFKCKRLNKQPLLKTIATIIQEHQQAKPYFLRPNNTHQLTDTTIQFKNKSQILALPINTDNNSAIKNQNDLTLHLQLKQTSHTDGLKRRALTIQLDMDKINNTAINVEDTVEAANKPAAEAFNKKDNKCEIDLTNVLIGLHLLQPFFDQNNNPVYNFR